MKKKRLAFLIGLGVVAVLSSFMIYWFYFSKPSSFPENDRVVKEINSLFPEANAKVIQATISVDDRHIVVPFISMEDDYGLSYWVWEKHKWQVATVDSKGQAKVWKINRKEPSTYYFVWNIPPKEQLNSIYFYLIRDRGYQVTEGRENYVPRVQMEKLVSLQKKSYGVQKLPNKWVRFMNSLTTVESAKQPNLFFHNVFPVRDIFFGWISYNQSGKETFPESTFNGEGYSNGDLNIEHLMMLNKRELD